MALPSALALAGINDLAAIVASDHRNNYAAVQAWVNAVTAMLQGAAAEDVFGWDAASATFKPVGVARVFNVKHYGAIGDGGVDDLAAIQAAHDAMVATYSISAVPFTGLSKLFFPPGQYKISAPLTLSKDACTYEFARGAMIKPSGAFDAVRLTGRDCTIHGLVVNGELNASGTVGNGITVGYGGAISYQTRLVDCEVWNMRGHGVLWEQGACLVLSNLYINGCNDGLRCTENYNDNNSGFLEANIINCRGIGLNVKNNAGVPNNSSRNHMFRAFRIFGCAGGGAVIETRENSGTLSLESNGTQDLLLTATSRSNHIILPGVPAAFNAASDLGSGNLISGTSSNDHWMDKRKTSPVTVAPTWSSNPVVNTGDAWAEVGVSGVLLGDAVIPGVATGRQVLLTAVVSLNDQVRLSIRNNTGANITPPASVVLTIIPAS